MSLGLGRALVLRAVIALSHALTHTHTATPPLSLQVPHDDNRLLLRNGLMMAAVAGVAACFGFLMVEARKMLML